MTSSRSLVPVAMAPWRSRSPAAVLVAVPDQRVLDGVGVRSALVVPAAAVVVASATASVPAATAGAVCPASRPLSVDRRRTVLLGHL